ncbi:peroxisome biogenesis factor 10, partial [Pichia californica]
MSDLWYSKILPFATAPSIVRSNQKDSYFISELENKITDFIRNVKGSRFISLYNKEIGMISKLIYFTVTTGVGARTLGEEYVDLNYVNRTGYRRIKLIQRIAFIILYVLIPYLMSRLMKIVGNNINGNENIRNGNINVVKKILNKLTFINIMDVMNLHLAFFYFGGQYDELSKRLAGMRYVFRYKPDNRSRQSYGNYEILGGLMMIQLFIKYSSIVKTVLGSIIKADNTNIRDYGMNSKKNSRKTTRREIGQGLYKNMAKMEQDEMNEIGENAAIAKDNNNEDDDYLNMEVTVVNLSDAKQLPYIGEQSRNCMLCLSAMKDPT